MYTLSNNFESPLTREDDREREQTFFRDHDVLLHEPWWSFRHTGPGLETLSCTDKNQLAVSFFVEWVFPRLALESCNKRVQLAREEKC